MNYLGLGVVGRAGARLVSSCKDLYNDLNGANLTGAIDVVVVKQADGSYMSTPFHVRFGKWGVLRTGDLQKEVEVEVNGEPVHNRMMLDESGSAFFIKPKHSMSFDVSDPIPEDVFHPRSHSLSSVPDPLHAGFYDSELESNSQSDHEKDEKPLSTINSSVSKKQSLLAEIMSMDTETTDSTGFFPDTSEAVINNESSNDSVSSSDNRNLDASTSDSDNASVSGDICEDRVSINTLTGDLESSVSGALCDTSDTIPRNSGDTFISTSPDSNSKGTIHVAIDTQDPSMQNIENQSSAPSANIQWLVDTTSSNKLATELDSGVLSDSAIELSACRRRYSPSVKSTLSDSEIDERSIRKTEGEVSHTQTTTQDSSQRGQQQLSQDASRYSLWGAIRGIWSGRKRRRFSSIEEGVYLDQLDSDVMGDKERDEYLLPVHGPSHNIEEDVPSDSSGVETISPLSSPSHLRTSSDNSESMDKIIEMLSDIAVSQCGSSDDVITEQSFTASQISFSEFCARPDLLDNSNTIFRINGRYYSWSVAAPMIMSAVLYQQLLPEQCQEELEKKHMSKDKSSRWHLWTQDETAIEKFGKQEDPSSDPHRVQSLPPRLLSDDPLSSDEEDLINERSMSKVRQRSLRRKRFVFTNELSSEELARWPLKPGKNELVFSTTTKYQGTAKAACTLYLWNYDDKIVVSDFDGTITRSDVAGQVLPFLGKDWTHFGVIELFSAIHNNGYKFLYLSARAIGQSMYTKNYLRSTRSRDCYLPDGPLLVTPFSLYKAFKKEVIERKPEEFKILSLQQIRSFFPKDYNPFHAGFGNKPSDAKSYLKVDIPSSKIYIVNPKGEVKNELTWTFQSSYTRLMDLIDGVFPPLRHTAMLRKQSTCDSISSSNDDSIASDTDYNTDSITDDDSSTSLFPDENYDSFLYWQRSLDTAFDAIELPDC